jgi:hypothetical protein
VQGEVLVDGDRELSVHVGLVVREVTWEVGDEPPERDGPLERSYDIMALRVRPARARVV